MTETYTTVEHDGVYEFEEKKSVFIGYAHRVTTEEEALSFVKSIRQKHFDARHNVHGFILRTGPTARYSDDGEPQGSAGMPVLDSIRKSGAEDVCVVVTRYFGGILLGTGGLIRAYAHSSRMALDAAHIITYEKYSEMSLICSYSDYQKLLSELPKLGAVIDGADFYDSVTVRYALKEASEGIVSEKICELTAGRTVPVKLGSRFDYSKNPDKP